MSDDGYLPQSVPNTGNSEYNAMTFMVRQILGQANIATLVEVKAIRTTGRTSAVGIVDVLPLVAQTDGSGHPVPHATIYGVPYLRTQGGACAIILDPHVGDIGLCVFADRDISSVKATHKTQPPGSKRRFNMADGFYFGGWNNVAPTSYIVIDDSSIDVVSPTAVNITTPKATVDGDLHVTGKMTGDKTAVFTHDVTGQGTSLHTHIHSGVTVGTANTGVPV